MDVSDQVIILENQLLKAIKNTDIDQLDMLLHEKLLFVNPIGQTITKAIDLQNYRSGRITIDKISAEGHNICMVENTAVVSVTINLKGKYLDNYLDESYQYLRVWIKEKNTWKVIAGSCVKM